jgi:PAT family beta-lactamase induction signal transducer AmpG
MDNAKKPSHPLLWIPSSYFSMGTIYITVTVVTSIMYRNMGLSIKEAALYASSLALPYTIKPLWAPVLEMFKTKKFFVVLMQIIIAGMMGITGIALGMDDFVASTMACFWIIGFAGSTMDIANDGVYVTTLNAKDQAKFTGFQGMCWNIGPVLAQGPLVTLTGVFHSQGMSWASSWRIVMFIIAGIMLASSMWHMKFLPQGSKAANAPRSVVDAAGVFWDSLVTFFQKKGVWMMIAFSFLYRTSQGFLDKIGPLFMIDAPAAGGLGLNNETLGTIVGSVGTPGFILGALLGGLYVSRRGLKNVLFILCAAVNIPNATYLILGYLQPENVYLIGTIVTLEKLFWGFGSVGHMLYMMQQLAPGPYKTAHYAFGTALMGLCMMLTGMASGYVHEFVGGYIPFFFFVMVATIPSFAVTWFAPFHHSDGVDR